MILRSPRLCSSRLFHLNAVTSVRNPASTAASTYPAILLCLPSSNVVVCGTNAMRTTVLAKYPRLNFKGLTSLPDVFAAVENGDCPVSIITSEFYASKQDHCNVVLMDQLLWAYPNSFPIRPDIQVAMSYALTLAENKAVFRNIANTWRQRENPPACESTESTNADPFKQVKCAIFISIAGATFALIIFMIKDHMMYRRIHVDGMTGDHHGLVRVPTLCDRASGMCGSKGTDDDTKTDHSGVNLIHEMTSSRDDLIARMETRQERLDANSPLTLGDVPLLLQMLQENAQTRAKQELDETVLRMQEEMMEDRRKALKEKTQALEALKDMKDAEAEVRPCAVHVAGCCDSFLAKFVHAECCFRCDSLTIWAVF